MINIRVRSVLRSNISCVCVCVSVCVGGEGYRQIPKSDEKRVFLVKKCKKPKFSRSLNCRKSLRVDIRPWPCIVGKSIFRAETAREARNFLRFVCGRGAKGGSWVEGMCFSSWRGVFCRSWGEGSTEVPARILGMCTCVRNTSHSNLKILMPRVFTKC